MDKYTEAQLIDLRDLYYEHGTTSDPFISVTYRPQRSRRRWWFLRSING